MMRSWKLEGGGVLHKIVDWLAPWPRSWSVQRLTRATIDQCSISIALAIVNHEIGQFQPQNEIESSLKHAAGIYRPYSIEPTRS